MGLTRKEILHGDQIREYLLAIYEWAAGHQKAMAIAVGVVLAAIVGAYLVADYRLGRSAELSLEFTKALKNYHAPIGETSAGTEGNETVSYASTQERAREAAQKFGEIAASGRSSPAGELAQYYKGLALIELGENSEAQTALQEVADASDPDLRNLARRALARFHEGENQLEEAAKLYNLAVEDPEARLPKKEILLRLGETFEKLNRTEDALKHYRTLNQDYSGSEEARKASQRISELEGPEEEKEEATTTPAS